MTSISGVGSNILPSVQSALNIDNQLTQLQGELTSGVKADTFSGLGSQAGVTIGLNAQLSALSAYATTNTIVGTRLALAQTSLGQLSSIANSVQAAAFNPTSFTIDGSGQTATQQTAATQLAQMLSVLNTPAGDRYIFSGTATTQPAVASADVILDGNGAAAGLKQVIAERNQADIGANGLGRLVIAPATAAVVGTGAALSPDATGTGTVALTGTTSLSSLGVATGDAITVSDGTHQTQYTVKAGDTVDTLAASLSDPPGAANVTVSVQGGRLQVQANNTTSTVTVSDSAGGADISALGFASGNTTFAPPPANPLTNIYGQTLTVTVGGAPAQTVTFGTGVGQVSTLAQLQTTLSADLGGTATASVDANGNLTVAATAATDPVTIGGSVSPAVFGLTTTSAPAGSTVTVSEDVAGSPFGFKLASVSSSLTGATVTGPTGSLDGISVGFGATPPNNGDSINVTLDLPDGSTQQVSLQATTTSPPGTGQFTIGTTPAATAANFQAALTTSVGTLAKTALSAASAMQAGNNFFASDPPLRVAGPPFDTATSLVAGTAANTVSWYTGENGPTSALSTATAQIGPSLSVSYGMRANQQGISWLVQNVAVLAATTYQQTDPNAAASYAALNQRVGSALAVPPGVQSISDVEASIAAAQSTMQTASTQQAQTQNTLTNMLQAIQGINQDQVGAEILSLQTTLQASLQVTAKLSQISLVNFLPTTLG
jgi:flagellin-like hook-associated protein FlgL